MDELVSTSKQLRVLKNLLMQEVVIVQRNYQQEKENLGAIF
jgi:hypothetical protein